MMVISNEGYMEKPSSYDHLSLDEIVKKACDTI